MGVNVKNNRNSLVVCSRKAPDRIVQVRLLPGDNDVDPEAWDFVKEHAGVKELLDPDTGCLEVKGGKANPHPTKASAKDKAAAHGRRADELKDFDLKQIKGIVADTDDAALLEAWNQDERKPVRELVRKRLRAVKKANA